LKRAVIGAPLPGEGDWFSRAGMTLGAKRAMSLLKA